MASARGRPPQWARSSPNASGSAVSRLRPTCWASSSRASSGSRTSRSIGVAACCVTRPPSRHAAGDDDLAAGSAGQQRGDLPAAGGVVQQDEHAFVCDQRAVETGAGLEVGRDRSGAESLQESAESYVGRDRLVGGIEAAEVDEELAVGEQGEVAVRPVEGQRGLADTAGAADRADRGLLRIGCGQRFG